MLLGSHYWRAYIIDAATTGFTRLREGGYRLSEPDGNGRAEFHIDSLRRKVKQSKKSLYLNSGNSFDPYFEGD